MLHLIGICDLSILKQLTLWKEMTQSLSVYTPSHQKNISQTFKGQSLWQNYPTFCYLSLDDKNKTWELYIYLISNHGDKTKNDFNIFTRRAVSAEILQVMPLQTEKKLLFLRTLFLLLPLLNMAFYIVF